jgi:transcriptional regulator with XRE-family HTH domain
MPPKSTKSGQPADRPAAKPRGPKAAPERSADLQIGARVRHARLLSGILMRELAERVGCTESTISKIESGRVVPSLPMLQRLIEALNRDFSSFFGADLNSPGLVQKAGQRPIIPTDPLRQGKGVSYERLVPFGAGNLLEANVHIIEPGGEKTDPITHQGESLGYLVEGQLELTIETSVYQLGPGDSFFYKNHLTTSYRNTGPTAARVVWINTPQVH